MAVHSHRCAFLCISVADQTAAALIYATATRCPPLPSSSMPSPHHTMPTTASHRHCHAVRYPAQQFNAIALQLNAFLFHCHAMHIYAFALRSGADPCHSLSNQGLALPCLSIALAMLFSSGHSCAKLCPCFSIHCFSFHCLSPAAQIHANLP